MDLYISILEFKLNAGTDGNVSAGDLCISILEFKYNFICWNTELNATIYVFLY